MHATSLVVEVRRGRRLLGVKRRRSWWEVAEVVEDDEGSSTAGHHLMVMLGLCFARRTQEARFASWSRRERTISLPGGKKGRI